MTARYDKLWTAVRNGGVAVLDGGVSTELERRGARMKGRIWSGYAALDAWDILVDTHRAYIDVGSNIITANTYASSRLMLEPTGFGDNVRDINLKSIEAAQTARERCGTPDVLIAGSISHVIPFEQGSEGATRQPNIATQDLYGAYAEMVSLHEEGGTDLILLEMMSLPARMKPLFRAAGEGGLPVWCGLSAKRKTADGPIKSWHDETVDFAANVAAASVHQFDVLGTMHTSADLIADTIPIIRRAHSGPIMAYPDSGYFVAPHWQFVDVVSPEEFRDLVISWIDQGVQIVGGCCGLGPEHIAAISDLSTIERCVAT